MAEANVSKALMTRLKKVGHATRIENLVGVGMPDVSYCVDGAEGFIENKWRSSWPKDPEGIVTLKHFTAQQRIWIADRARAGGSVFVLLGVGIPVTDWLLLDGAFASARLGLASKGELVRGARVASLGAGFPWEAIRKCL